MPRTKNTAATAEKKTTSRTRKAAAPSNGTPQVPMSVVSLSEEQVRARAYELYESRGRQDGSHESDWFKAEAELRSHSA